MKLTKNRLLSLLILCLLLPTLFTPSSTIAFSSDSYSQDVGDEYIWEITVVKYPGPGNQLGDRLKVCITTANRTMVTGILCDTLYVKMYNNSVADRTWTPYMGMTSEVLAGAYNSSYGIVGGSGNSPYIMPHNETAVNSFLYFMMHTSGPHLQNYVWTSGPHGYDGTMTAWNGSAAGDSGQLKIEMQYNEEGVLQYMIQYFGLGPGWDIIIRFDLRTPRPPVLQPITRIGNQVSLKWNSVATATVYYVYRSTTPITSVTGLQPIKATASLTYQETVPLGLYYYVIVAGTTTANSTPSNCEQVIIPSQDSFSQLPSDTYVWEITANETMFPLPVGSRMKLEITDRNYTLDMGILYDTLWGCMYQNAPADRTWILMGSGPIAMYNSTDGIWKQGMGPFIAPHNETVINATLYIWMMSFDHYQWTSGPHGYDGIAVGWSGSSTGDLGKLKGVLHYNKDGVLEYVQQFNGTGSGWHLIYELRLLSIPQAPQLTSVTSSGYTVTLNWTAVTGATIYYIYRSTSEITSLTGLTPIGATANLYYVDKVESSGTYYYVVQAGNSVGNSTQSNCKSVVVTISGGIPGFTLPLCLIPLIFLVVLIGLINFGKRSKRFQNL